MAFCRTLKLVAGDMSDTFHFPDVSYVCGSLRIKINLKPYEQKHIEAQQWLGDRVLEDCRSRMPLLTGNLQQRSYVDGGGRQVVFPGPSARFQYGGKVMVDPDTGSPWARKGVKKVLTDRPLTYSNPQATHHWFDTAKAQYGDYWINGVKERIGGK